jgi:aminoglycoside phosphotransferase (APT) family kinase protein
VTDRVEALFPEFRGRSIIQLAGGWDFDVFEVDDEWIVRLPNRDEVAHWLAREVAVLPAVAPTLPVDVPHFELTRGADGVAYRKLSGAELRAEDATASVADTLGRFLRALHAFPVPRALALGADDRSGERTSSYFRDVRWPIFREHVVPLLSEVEQEEVENRATRYVELSASVDAALVHRDLGPEHVLVRDGIVTGVIDWTDALVGDPAIDFAWLVHGVRDDFGRDVLAAYGAVDEAFLERARFLHVLGPFYEVHYGLFSSQPQLIESGLAGIRDRLERWPSSA